VVAFSADGTENCAGIPKQCTPIWFGNVPLPPGVAPGSGPVVADGVVYRSGSDHLSAFDAAGSTGCSPGPTPGDPRTCTPLWTANEPGIGGESPTVANGFVFTAGIDATLHGRLYAFDAAAQNGCAGSPLVCTPVWRADLGAFAAGQAPAVANGLVYVATGTGVVRVFDAAGARGCSGTPLVCQPLWTANVGVKLGLTTAAVTGDGLFVVTRTDNVTPSKLYAFDASGVRGCTGSPATCTPLWSANTGGPGAPPAIANHVVYVAGATLQSFDARGETSCAGTPKVCAPLWTSSEGVNVAPLVANGLVFAVNNAFIDCNPFCRWDQQLVAYDAAGVTNCSATHVCDPLWRRDNLALDETATDPILTNGVLFFADDPAATRPIQAFTVP
jgi:hypothetical protein